MIAPSARPQSTRPENTLRAGSILATFTSAPRLTGEQMQGNLYAKIEMLCASHLTKAANIPQSPRRTGVQLRASAEENRRDG